MHLLFTIATVLIALKWADWKNWQKYHLTMLFVIIGNLLYNYLYHEHYLWVLKSDAFPNSTIVEILYTFVLFPLTVLLFLSNYPNTVKGQIIRNLKFIAIYIIIEWVYLKLGRIVHNYGWNIWWSLAWDCMMFPMWVLHHKKPLVAYGVSALTVVIMLMLFPVNFSK